MLVRLVSGWAGAEFIILQCKIIRGGIIIVVQYDVYTQRYILELHSGDHVTETQDNPIGSKKIYL